jgi:hypothetical protein
MPQGEARLLSAGCPLDQFEPCGDCLTYGPGHYESWAQWRRDKTVDPALRAIVRSCEYEDWPRGRIVFNRARDLLAVAPQCEPWIFLSLDDGLLADYSVGCSARKKVNHEMAPERFS